MQNDSELNKEYSYLEKKYKIVGTDMISNLKSFLYSVLFSLCIIITQSCNSKYSQSNDGSSGPINSASDGGTMTVTLTSEGSSTIGFSVTPNCRAETDYLICLTKIFNTDRPLNVSPLVYEFFSSQRCFEYSTNPLTMNGVPCTPCTTGDCIAIEVICTNMTRGPALRISQMPPNVSCS